MKKIDIDNHPEDNSITRHCFIEECYFIDSPRFNSLNLIVPIHNNLPEEYSGEIRPIEHFNLKARNKGEPRVDQSTGQKVWKYKITPDSYRKWNGQLYEVVGDYETDEEENPIENDNWSSSVSEYEWFVYTKMNISLIVGNMIEDIITEANSLKRFNK